MDNFYFVKLCSRGWSLPVLAALADDVPARVSPVAAHLSASRTSITDTFQHLCDLGLIARNPGHGHPLRPEFQLTGRGRRVATWSFDLARNFDPETWSLARKCWSLPVMRLLQDEQRYGALRRGLPNVTDRALSLCLRTLVANDWLARSVQIEMTPPQVTYRSTGFGREIQPWLQTSYKLLEITS